MVAAEVLGMLGISYFAALLPTFTREWHLSSTDAGWISGAYYAAYAAAVLLLTSLTDRVDARFVYLASTGVGGLASLGFSLTARGFWSALLWQLLAGIGLAGTYMPGLKALTDRLVGPIQSRALASYTSGFSLGISASFLLAGELGVKLGWRRAFLVATAASVVAFCLAAVTLRRRAALPAQDTPHRRLLDFRPVLSNRDAMGYALAYGGHLWELFGMRAWVVAFLAFGVTHRARTGAILSPTWIATGLTLLGVVFSVGGNELALRFGRRRTLVPVMLLSAAAACGIGFLGDRQPWIVALATLGYGALVMADSSSLTAGVVECARPGYRGATMAVHSTVGFVGAFLGPVVFGVVLDVAGGPERVGAWGMAFASLGLAVGCGSLALVVLRPSGETQRPNDARAAALREGQSARAEGRHS